MKKYLILGAFVIIVLAVGIFLFYSWQNNDESVISIKVDEPQNDIFVSSFYNDIKEIKNPSTGMRTSDEDYIQRIADVLSQFKLKHIEKETVDDKVKYGWIGIEFKYNDSDRIVTIGVRGENEISVDEDNYIVENDNYKELIEKFSELIYYIPENIGRRDELYPQSQ